MTGSTKPVLSQQYVQLLQMNGKKIIRMSHLLVVHARVMYTLGVPGQSVRWPDSPPLKELQCIDRRNLASQKVCPLPLTKLHTGGYDPAP